MPVLSFATDPHSMGDPISENTLTRLARDGRDGARKGVFSPPFPNLSFFDRDPVRAAAQAAYCGAYWAEFQRLRFEAGIYDLL